MEKQPIKRHDSLRPLSRQHHHGLLLCWKIREGFRRNVTPERIKKYADWFWQNHLQQHFEEEEKYVFVVLPTENKLLKKAIAEHRRLERLFKDQKDTVRSLNLIEEELEQHIRFEERLLFNEIQQNATPEQLNDMELHHTDLLCDNWDDEFWKN